ncbi:gpW family head-tail joining protein [Neoroseomonas lacus]|uniref:Phage tail protein n=1 Tax=Neoroseomonas lacus TaxID=287609 RepID=A0A917NNL0_9PROT|nr:gpW family head-tail joining protein [Neoroseomonas lacus]GGJ14112.1 hypothetical protein GCM10011320_21730 [Neoroseomonas lacus]
MADAATLQARLSEAETAYHRLLTGSKAEQVTYAAGQVSRSMKYTQANIDALRGYIADLRRELCLPSRRRAIGVRF